MQIIWEMGRSGAKPRRPLGDGRRERSAQTRQQIIEAYLELLRASPRIPTAVEIAVRRAARRDRSTNASTIS